ncbi:MAG: type I-C CRISPR-associated protein Cas8c/Csd1 [Caulobacteraceae bacterium]|nr:type I-C CRISPR-associated protein Cas8c/Csd1 [Caulobacteraceae bacterium]
MTILQSLDRYYDRMAARGEAEAPGWSREKISFAIVLSPEGEAIDVNDLRDWSTKKPTPRQMEVPAAVKRTAGISPNLFWDKSAYLLGRTAGEGRRTADEHKAFVTKHLELLAGETDEGLTALRTFLRSWTSDRFDSLPFRLEMLDANIVFQLEGERRHLHDREAARRFILARSSSDHEQESCLVTGLMGPVARLHPTIKGVEGAQSSGASLVSFNHEAFDSFGKKNGDNAPTSEAAAFRYGAALNRMLDRGSRNRLPRPVGDAAIVFWADTSDTVGEVQARETEDFFAALSEPPDDAEEAAKLGDALQKLADGRPLRDLSFNLAERTRFHVLGLSPNAARLSVRYWLDDDFEQFARRLARHYADLAIEPAPWRAKPPSIQRLLVKTTALQEKFDNIPNGLAGEVMRAVLSGAPYPRTWLAAAIIRLRAGDSPGSGWHAAVIKACLNRPIILDMEDLQRRGADPERVRKLEQEMAPVALDPANRSEAYQLGRLFSVLESAQRAALGRQINATIADRYYAAASSTPARVFAALIRGAKTHISDAKKRNTGHWIEPRLQEIIAQLPPDLPTSLRLEDQGRFAVGYYHERAFRPTKADEATDETTDSKETA